MDRYLTINSVACLWLHHFNSTESMYIKRKHIYQHYYNIKENQLMKFSFALIFWLTLFYFQANSLENGTL
jgi:hypothetical protein